MDTFVLNKAIKFAVDAHNGAERRGKGFPYIVHPMEVISIVASMTSDQELLAAAALHDVVEDTEITIDEIEREFGKRVAELVEAESDKFIENISLEDSWHGRKQAAIERLKNASYDAKMVALGDKLSNMRAIARDYAGLGDELWQRFHTTDPAEHEWHYRGLAGALAELSETNAYKEFVALIDETFAATDNTFSFEKRDRTIFVSGAVGREEAKIIAAELGNGEQVLDFDKVTSISFAALRALLNCQNDGATCRISNASPKVCAMFDTTGVSKFISVCQKPREFDMSTVNRSGDGFTSESYFCNDNDSMIKIYSEGVPQRALEQEKRYAQAAMFAGIPTPLSGDLIKVGNCNGIVFERIMEKKSFARAIADDPDNIETYTKQFAEVCKKLHETPCDKNMFPSLAEVYRQTIINCDIFADEDKKAVLKILDNTPETGCCLHGDLHVGNVIIADGKSIFIDMADFGYGNSIFDLASIYFTAKYTPEERTMNMFHFGNETMLRFWELFVHYYYGVDNPKKIAEIEAQLHPYAAFRVVFFAKAASGAAAGHMEEGRNEKYRNFIRMFIK